MTDEDGADRLQLPFGQVVERTAVDHDASVDGAVTDDQAGVFDEAGEEGRFQVAEETAHGKDQVKVKVKVKVKVEEKIFLNLNLYLCLSFQRAADELRQVPLQLCP
jgi:hypothetical protein